MSPQEIYYYRQSLHLSQADMANKLGVRQATVSDWENGKNKASPLAVAQLKALAGAREVLILQTDFFLRIAHWRIDHTQSADGRSYIGRPVKDGDNTVHDWIGPLPPEVADWIFEAIERKQKQDSESAPP